MPHKEEIFKALNRMVTAQSRVITRGISNESSFLDKDTESEEIQADELSLLNPPSLSRTPLKGA